ncbi:hypothetical protein GDO86_015569 [Hymenochirus boettgeri]|uniref:Uncharacterized protein n=1 Tax=Hymenochirus boettgeri TaxID=247094 RepID=A0A8T2JTF3_9PIPI|nr:hypothetical protein GDO86_015569 [Hymenochirus boettgeri]
MDSSSSDNEDSSSPLLSPSSPASEEEEDAFEILSRITVSTNEVPWEQRSSKMKILHVVDRIFLYFLAAFFIVLFIEILYILYHTVPWAGISHIVKDQLLFSEEGEEEMDL